MSQLAVLLAAQIPFRLGLPSAIRAGPAADGACADVRATNGKTAKSAAIDPVIQGTSSQCRMGMPPLMVSVRRQHDSEDDITAENRSITADLLACRRGEGFFLCTSPGQDAGERVI